MQLIEINQEESIKADDISILEVDNTAEPLLKLKELGIDMVLNNMICTDDINHKNNKRSLIPT